MRKLGVLIAIVVVLAVSAYAVDLGGGLVGFFASMVYPNSLIDTFATDNVLTIPGLHVGWGMNMNVSLFSFMENIDMGLGIRYLNARTGARDVSVGASLAGMYAWGGYRIGRWQLAIDAGGYRGSFSFAAARYQNLVGWNGGVTGSVSYFAIATGTFSLGSAVSLQWLPIGEMHDTTGQRYRGRGAPFLDFSGVSVSILFSWNF